MKQVLNNVRELSRTGEPVVFIAKGPVWNDVLDSPADARAAAEHSARGETELSASGPGLGRTHGHHRRRWSEEGEKD